MSTLQFRVIRLIRVSTLTFRVIRVNALKFRVIRVFRVSTLKFLVPSCASTPTSHPKSWLAEFRALPQRLLSPSPDVLRFRCCFSQAAVLLGANHSLNRLRGGATWLDVFAEPESFEFPTSLASFRNHKPSDKMLKEWGDDDTRMAAQMRESWYMFHLVSTAKSGLITMDGQPMFQDETLFGSTTITCGKLFIQAEKGLCQPKACKKYVRDLVKRVVEFAFDCAGVISTVPIPRPASNVLDLPRPPLHLMTAEDSSCSWSSPSSTPTAERKKHYKQTAPRTDPPSKKSRTHVLSDDDED